MVFEVKILISILNKMKINYGYICIRFLPVGNAINYHPCVCFILSRTNTFNIYFFSRFDVIFIFCTIKSLTYSNLGATFINIIECVRLTSVLTSTVIKRNNKIINGKACV